MCVYVYLLFSFVLNFDGRSGVVRPFRGEYCRVGGGGGEDGEEQ